MTNQTSFSKEIPQPRAAVPHEFCEDRQRGAKPDTGASPAGPYEILKIVFQNRIVPPGGFVKMAYFVPEKRDKVVANSFDVR
jgi:hypothetical protein